MGHDEIFEYLYNKLEFFQPIYAEGDDCFKVYDKKEKLEYRVFEYTHTQSSFLYNCFYKPFYESNLDSNIIFGNKYVRDCSTKKGLNITRNIDLKKDKIYVTEYSLNPCPEKYFKEAFEKFIFSKRIILKALRSRKMIIFINFILEADWFGTPTKQCGNTNYFEVLQELYKKYKIPPESIVFFSSNLRGEELDIHNQYFGKYTHWYDNFWEHETFRRMKGDVSGNDYTFEEHFNNLKNSKSDEIFLRMNRTPGPYRDMILYWSKKLNVDKYLKIEHLSLDFLNPQFCSELDEYFGYTLSSKDLKMGDIENILDVVSYDSDIYESIKKQIPIKASKQEKEKGMVDWNQLVNETIPHEVYRTTPLSYVVGSFPSNDNYVFLNMGVFNPIYYYHPLLLMSNAKTIEFLIKSEYKSFGFIFNENYDKMYDVRDRFYYSFKEMYKVIEMGKNKVLDIIYDNQEDLIFNRNKLIENDSITSFINKLYFHLMENYKSLL